MEEDIKIIKASKIMSDDIEHSEHSKRLRKAIENLIKGYRELEEYIRRLDELNARDFIFKSTIKEKIEELEKEKTETYTKFLGCNRNNDSLSTKGKMLEGGIQVLQELMEDK